MVTNTHTNGGVPSAHTVALNSTTESRKLTFLDSLLAQLDDTSSYGFTYSRYRCTLQVLVHAQVIYVDTSFLMHDFFGEFWKRYSYTLRFNGVRLSIISQVEAELHKKSQSSDETTRQKALGALRFLRHHRMDPLLHFCNNTNYPHLADFVFCSQLFHHHLHRNQVLLTHDGALTSSVYNLCCTSHANTNFFTIMFDIARSGLLRCQEGEYLVKKGLSPLVELPSALVSQPLTPSPLPEVSFMEPTQGVEPYFHDAAVNGIIHVSRDALQFIFENEEHEVFLQRASELGLTLYVVAPSLTVELWEKMAAWPQLFHVIFPEDCRMPEEDALLDALYTSSFHGKGLHHLLISQSPELGRNLISRRPKCYTSLPLWSVCLTEEGYMHRAVVQREPQQADLPAVDEAETTELCA